MESIKRERSKRPRQSGELHPKAKLSKYEVDEIRERANDGEAYAQLALIYGVSETQIRRIVRGINWTN
jgi:Mor family transcriptional regulator